MGIGVVPPDDAIDFAILFMKVDFVCLDCSGESYVSIVMA